MRSLKHRADLEAQGTLSPGRLSSTGVCVGTGTVFGVAHICNSPPPPGPEEELRKCRLVSVSLVFPPIYVSVQVKTCSFLHEVLYSSC